MKRIIAAGVVFGCLMTLWGCSKQDDATSTQAGAPPSSERGMAPPPGVAAQMRAKGVQVPTTAAPPVKK